jgi:hypothetical protein
MIPDPDIRALRELPDGGIAKVIGSYLKARGRLEGTLDPEKIAVIEEAFPWVRSLCTERGLHLLIRIAAMGEVCFAHRA